jgi:hypothetical protein
MRAVSKSFVLLLLAGCVAPDAGNPDAASLDAASREAPTPAATAPPAALPERRHGHRIERVAGGYLCIGGHPRGAGTERGPHQTLWLADGDDTWRRRADCPQPHTFFGSGVHAGDVVAIGASVERYDAATDRWHQLVPADGRLPRSHFGACVLDGSAWVLGGFPEVATGFHEVDLVTGSVTAHAPPPTFAHGDHFHFVCSLGGELHVLGGIDSDVSDMLREHWVRRDGDWVRIDDCPHGLWAKFTGHVVHRGSLWLLGGLPGNLSYRYRPDTATWTEHAGPPAQAAMPVAVATDDALWIVGGMPIEGRSNILWRYDLATDTWDVRSASM